jgi:F-type H+-transporting ATPase subunit delta
LLAVKRGEVTADVTSAHPLNDAQIQSLKASLKTATGRDVQLNTNVDASLLGGLVVKVGSRMIDSSLKTKLTSLKLAMKEAS